MTLTLFTPARRCGVFAALSFALPVSAQAQEEAPAILVEANLADPASDAATSAKLLDEDRPGVRGVVSVTEDLSLLPGVVAFDKGGPGAGSYVSIRGGEPNFALVTINGVRVDDPLNSSGGGLDFSLIDPEIVQRIAVVSGPQSTAYGADALSGVIALDVGPLGSGASAHAGIGSEGRYRFGGSLGVEGDAGSFGIAGGFLDSDDFVPGTTSERYSIAATASPDLGATVSFDLFAVIAGSESEGFPEDSGGPQLAVIGELETRERQQIAVGGTLAAALAPDLTAQLRLGYSQSDLETDAPGIAPGALDGVPPIVSDSQLERYEAVASLTHRPADWLSLEVGTSFTREDGESTGSLDFGVLIPTAFTIERDMPGVFTTVTIAPGSGVELSGGLRVDWPEDASARWTPRIGASVPVAETGTRLFANYARGFKRPSLFALGFPLIANPDLEDERSETFDAGVELTPNGEGWSLTAAYFNATYRNLVDFEPELFTNVNRSRVEIDGFEAAGTLQMGEVSARAALTYQTTSSADGAQLRFRPDWTGRLAIRWQALSTLAITLNGEFSSSFNDASVPTGLLRNPGFETLALDAEWQANKNVAIFGALRNLTDSDFERTVGFPEPGRNVFVGVRTRF
ncbi:TonB-dependent receptor [Erythrobacter sp. NAP1]|uniref:TonB-dependent receptor plug domain-containing protein n=1 Tax=Erythrobacter sp. NAP1 TaxID=237727 RepID=UPI00006876B7|nr:TonB-dependent receptor [Erythrobacter sp. NAP1]EAQ28719.1 TonB-dependent receptor [Erythrobacter sp. NAP1]